MMPGTWTASPSPGNEQRGRWSSAAANAEGAYNIAGAAEPAIDAMIAAILAAKSNADFVAAVRALDRLLISGFYIAPFFYAPEEWIAYSAKLGRPRRRRSSASISRRGGARRPDRWRRPAERAAEVGRRNQPFQSFARKFPATSRPGVAGVASAGRKHGRRGGCESRARNQPFQSFAAKVGRFTHLAPRGAAPQATRLEERFPACFAGSSRHEGGVWICPALAVPGAMRAAMDRRRSTGRRRLAAVGAAKVGRGINLFSPLRENFRATITPGPRLLEERSDAAIQTSSPLPTAGGILAQRLAEAGCGGPWVASLTLAMTSVGTFARGGRPAPLRSTCDSRQGAHRLLANPSRLSGALAMGGNQSLFLLEIRITQIVIQ